MRRKQMQGGRHNNNQRRGGGHYNNNNNRSRKNYPQLREKYIQQARDALSGGDRVMAEYYFQHADHCYRMMLEDGYKPRNDQNSDGQGDDSADTGDVSAGASDGDASASTDDAAGDSSAELPSFLTMDYTAQAAKENVKKAASAPAQNWEE